MKIDGRENIRELWNNNFERGKNLHFAACDRGVKPGLQFARDGIEVFLEHLCGNDTQSAEKIILNQRTSQMVLPRIAMIVSVNKNIRIEKRP